MRIACSLLALGLSVIGSGTPAIAPAQAQALRNAITVSSSQNSLIEPVQYRRYRGGYYGGGYYGGGDVAGAAIAGGLLGLAAGAAIAGAANSAPPPGYYGGGAPVDPNWIAYCARKYRSFDPASGTYLAYDGNRYMCQ
ncbi:BA14K family protein [Beijerinckia indica]|uniref:Lectin-like protein BA14k n=1 Tax=Beijerinckia indica subsp. indica (strain ATCC 9039 / DSM 1715 / NCIMB 8712) TaxID=395963 RepID=B2IHU1_BEII9|nr:BA14K family protein [Beijerinckia indica]ACB95984.1 conserved hypothetical protein [Beijerinckia indica subsp. indica ATCC 9039]